MQLFIRSPAGLVTVEAAAGATVQSIIDEVASQCAIESNDASLVYAGQYLSVDSIISEVGLTEVCFRVFMVLYVFRNVLLSSLSPWLEVVRRRRSELTPSPRRLVTSTRR